MKSDPRESPRITEHKKEKRKKCLKPKKVISNGNEISFMNVYIKSCNSESKFE